MEFSVYVVMTTGIVIRLLIFDTDISQWLSDRNEISTPITSWRRLTEGLKLLRTGISPYDGDVYHEMPLTLALWNRADEMLGPSIKYAFIALDTIIGIVLYGIASSFAAYTLKRQAIESKSYHSTSKKLIIRAEDMKINRLYVLAVYMLNPLGIASCVAKSTGILSNLSIVLAFYYTVNCSRFKASLFLAIATYVSLYPIVLIIPFAFFFAHKDARDAGVIKSLFISSCFQTIVCFLSFLGFLLYASHFVEGNWNFLRSTVGFILEAPDHSPNIGIFWYFFTELFDHFKLFFLCVFQIHAFLYVLPISCRLFDEPFFAGFLVLAFVSVFKSYPSYGDVSLWGSMAFLWHYAFKYMRNSFPSFIAFVVSIVLGPVFWHLWLFAGSANANFYFSYTLVSTSAQVFIIFDLLFAYQKRKFELRSGMNQVGPDGKPVKYILD